MPKWSDLKRFCERDGWELYKTTDHFFYRKHARETGFKNMAVLTDNVDGSDDFTGVSSLLSTERIYTQDSRKSRLKPLMYLKKILHLEQG